MLFYNFIIAISSLVLSQEIICMSQTVNKDGPTPYHDWDYIMYTQRWPITACAEWEEAKQDNTCNLPSNKTTWTIHGLWPTKTGTEGPLFCPSAIHFDPEALNPILDQLNLYWVNIEANTKPDSFWKHEWDKHGTCASTLPELDSIQNYFQQGLNWNRQFDLAQILSQNKINPGNDGYTIDQIYNAVKSYTNKDPMIQCVVDRKSKESMISEIRICLDKNFDVIDCDHSNPVNKNKLEAITNCNLKKQIMYFADVPVNDISYEIDVDNAFKQHFEEQMYYMSIYRLLRFLIWFTT